MTDHQDTSMGRQRSGASVAELASRAIETLAQRRGPARPLLSERLIDQLVRASHAIGETAVEGAFADMLHAGVPHDEILDFYIPEAARRLGDAWCDDKLGFADVTIGAARLQRAVRKLSAASRLTGRQQSRRPAIGSALVIVPEGESHTLGPTLLTEQLRRRGVSVRLMLSARTGDILDTVADGSFEAIFLSLAVADALASTAALVKKIRQEAKGATIVVGGVVCSTGLDVRGITGADYVGSDARGIFELCGLTNSRLAAATTGAGISQMTHRPAPEADG